MGIRPIFILLLLFLGYTFISGFSGYGQTPESVSYFIDSDHGNDSNTGRSADTPWRSPDNLRRIVLQPSDSVRFKRGTSYQSPVHIDHSGTEEQYIVICDFGDPGEHAPKFTNKVFEQGNFGNCIRLRGDYILVENLFFHGTSAYQPGEYDTDGWDVWQMGAIFIDKGSEHCIVRNNEIVDCVVGIKSYGEYALIEKNYIHDCNRVLKEWNWGPIGIWLCADHQEVRYNRIINYRAEDEQIVWNGADGSAIEIDDGRCHKSDISIHHNYTRECQGFLEVTGSDMGVKPRYENFRIHHNISDDFQWFVGLWRSKNFSIDHNTVIRTRVNSNEKGVFHITTRDAGNYIRNNIIVTRDSIVVFNTGENRDNKPENLIQNNLYFATDGKLKMGREGPGETPVFGDPRFRNYSNRSSEGDYTITKRSKGIDKALKLEVFSCDVPCGSGPDIGAFEFCIKRKSEKIKNQ